MKKLSLLIVVMLFSITALTLAIFFAGCGGGGSKSGLKKNDYLGSLPAIYADYQLAKKADEEKIDKLHTSGNLNKIMKEVAKIEKEEKERELKFEADLKAEMAKITGKDVPFTCSEAFKKLNCEVVFMKFSDHSTPGIIASIVAKNDFTVSSKERNVDDYEYVWYRAVAKDGSTIDKNSIFLFSVSWGNTKQFTKGQSLKSGSEYAQTFLSISKKPEQFADFAGIEFITREEFNNLK